MTTNLALSSEASTPRPTSLVDTVYRAILNGVADGTYAPNDRLPSEHDLAGQFGVSRPVVRSALDRLRREGTIVSRRGAGSFVRVSEAKQTLGFAPVESIADIQPMLRVPADH